MSFLKKLVDKIGLSRWFAKPGSEPLLGDGKRLPLYSSVAGEDAKEEINAASPLPQAPETPPTISSFEALSKLKTLIFANARLPYWSIALSTLNTGLNFLIPYLFGEVITLLSSQDEEVTIGGTTFNRTALIATLTTSYALAQILPNVRDQLIALTKARATKDLIKQDTEHLLNKSLHSHTIESSARQLLVFQRSFFMLDSTIPPLLAQIIPTFLETTVATAVLATQYDVEIGVGVLALVAVFTGYSALTAKPIVAARAAALTAGNDVFEVFSNALANYKPMRDFGQFDYTMRRVNDSLNKYATADAAATNIPLRTTLGYYLLARGGMLAACLYAAERLKQGDYEMRDLIILFTYLNQLCTSMPAFGLAVNNFIAAFPDLKFVFTELANTRGTVVDNYPNVRLPVPLGAAPSIEFDNVTFRYPSKPKEALKPPIFTNLSFRIAAGEKVALISPSGAGKTSLFNLLYRYYDPEGGTIRVNGIDIEKVSLKDLQNNISLLGQDANLFKGSIRKNICFGAEDPDVITDPMIWSVARLSGLEGFLQGFADGLDTDVGEAGKALSGGQKQKVAILRGLLKDCSIRLMDEITAPLDFQSATLVLSNILERSQGTTTLMITHKLGEAAQYMDRILVIANGGLIAEGTHDQLLESCDLYRTLWINAQRAPQAEAPSIPDSTGRIMSALDSAGFASDDDNSPPPVHSPPLHQAPRKSSEELGAATSLELGRY